MSGKAPSLDGVQWTEGKTRKGKSYEAGHTTEKPDKEVSASGPSFGVSCNWPVSTDWVYTDSDFASKTAITRYWLQYQPDSTYSYCLYFTNTDHYDYSFSDETGDSYGCDTWVDSDHYVQYNSDSPTIIYISGD